MHNLILGTIIGLIIGAVSGATIIAPRLIQMPNPVSITETPQGLNDQIKKATNKPEKRQSLEKEPVRWRVASAYGSTLPQLGELGIRLETLVSVLSDGTFQIKLHEPETLVQRNEMFDAVLSGTIDAAFAAPTFWSKQNPAFQLYSAIPFGPPPQEYLSWYFFGGGDEMLHSLYKSHGLHGLICGITSSAGSNWFLTPIESLEKLKLTKINIRGLGRMVVRQLGAQTVELEDGEILKAFEEGMIDGTEASQPAVDLHHQFYRVAQNYYFPGWHQPASFLHLIINAEVWSKLPNIRKMTLKTACNDNIAHGLALAESQQFKALKEFTRNGVKIQTWSPKIINALRDSWAKTRKKLEKSSPSFKSVSNSLKTFREKHAIWREISSGLPPN